MCIPDGPSVSPINIDSSVVWGRHFYFLFGPSLRLILVLYFIGMMFYLLLSVIVFVFIGLLPSTRCVCLCVCVCVD